MGNNSVQTKINTNMVGKIKQILLDKYPKIVINTLHIINKQNVDKTNKILFEKSDGPDWLSYEDLKKMQKSFKPGLSYGYHIEALLDRGNKRSKVINKLTGDNEGVSTFLELGARDGIVSYYLDREYGKKCTYLDIDPVPPFFVEDAGVKCIKADAMNIPLADNSFDCIFSYNAMEHFPDPRKALTEAIRVAKPGAYIYFDFGPVYMAPKGYHAYVTINIPYCHLLFKDETLNEYCTKNNLGELKFALGKGLNGWQMSQYRALWEEVKEEAETVIYREYPDYKHLDVVKKYPSCFKAKIDGIDSLYISRIEILMRKR